MAMAAREASPFSNFSTSALEAFSKRKNGIKITPRNKARMVAAHERVPAVKHWTKTPRSVLLSGGDFRENRRTSTIGGAIGGGWVGW